MGRSGRKIRRSTGSPAFAGTGKAKRLTIRLVPLTERAQTALPAEGLILTDFPFRIGRASAHSREPDPLQMNDLILPDEDPHFVSKIHLSLDVEGGQAIVRDRGSKLGTIVNGVSIGGSRRGGSAPLREGDNEIVVGPENSPFRFRVRVN